MVFQQWFTTEDLRLAWGTAQNNSFILEFAPESIDELPHPEIYREVEKLLFT